MNVKASGRSALILATGFFVCFAGPSQAATDADDAAASSTIESAGGTRCAQQIRQTRLAPLETLRASQIREVALETHADAKKTARRRGR